MTVHEQHRGLKPLEGLCCPPAATAVGARGRAAVRGHAPPRCGCAPSTPSHTSAASGSRSSPGRLHVAVEGVRHPLGQRRVGTFTDQRGPSTSTPGRTHGRGRASSRWSSSLSHTLMLHQRALHAHVPPARGPRPRGRRVPAARQARLVQRVAAPAHGVVRRAGHASVPIDSTPTTRMAPAAAATATAARWRVSAVSRCRPARAARGARRRGSGAAPGRRPRPAAAARARPPGRRARAPR